MNRGDVVRLDWPYSDFSGSKVRPGVVVQADFLNGLIDDSIFVQITSTRHAIPGTEVEIDPTVEVGSGLTKRCYASCYNVLTLDQGRVLRAVGYLSDQLMLEIEACLKATLAIR